MEGYIKLKVDILREFTVNVLVKFGVPVDDAEIVVDVLITADQRGIGSHGLQRFKRYINGLKRGVMKPVADWKVLKETPNTLLISGGDGLGQVVSYRTMELVIDKALKNNVAFAVVRDSNHYGIAGYYPMMALKHDLIGISGTNTSPLVAPTFGKDLLLGTNPLSIAVPADRERPFVLDMALSTVPRGKLEVYGLQGKPMPLTWALDESGTPTSDASEALSSLAIGKGGLLPLGGAGEESGGHKGYGLCLAVDILSGVLSGSIFGPYLQTEKDEPATKVSHFFGAMRIDAFIELSRFKSLMDDYIRIIKNSGKALGHDRIFIHGEKEFELYEKQREEVSIFPQVVEELRMIGKEAGLEAPF